MNKTINIKDRVVDMSEVDTGKDEAEIIKYLDKKMKVRFHDVIFNNSNYVFTGTPDEQVPNSITVSGYEKRDPSSKSAVLIR